MSHSVSYSMSVGMRNTETKRSPAMTRENLISRLGTLFIEATIFVTLFNAAIKLGLYLTAGM